MLGNNFNHKKIALINIAKSETLNWNYKKNVDFYSTFKVLKYFKAIKKYVTSNIITQHHTLYGTNLAIVIFYMRNNI